MATFTELCNDVITITGRDDLVADTQLAVRAATLKLHQSDFYARDLLETGIQFPSMAYYQSFDPKLIYPTFRALKYIRRYDNSGSGAAAEFFTVLTPTDILDSYGLERTGIAYMAGTLLNIRSEVQFQYALMGAYLNPDIVNYSSWVAIDHPFAIVYEAARLVFKQIGYDEQSAAFERLAMEQLSLLKMANVQTVGY